MIKFNMLTLVLLLLIACKPAEWSKKEHNTPSPAQLQQPESLDDGLKASQPQVKKSPITPDGTNNTVNDEVCGSIIEDYAQIPKDTSSFLLLTEFSRDFLEAHNDIRQRYKLKKFIWDNSIASYAQAWADYLRDNKDCQMMHRSAIQKFDGQRYGENLALNMSNRQLELGKNLGSPRMAVFAWSEECRHYNYEKNSCTVDEQCGHLTQMVWRDSQRIGCGVATCRSEAGQKNIWVCNYDPPGNYLDPNAPKERQVINLPVHPLWGPSNKTHVESVILKTYRPY